ncbi:MAG: hypothetical protein QW791_08710 [Candidatus Bathyarchaeia archaeon]
MIFAEKGEGKMKKIVSSVILALILINMLTIAFSIQKASAKPAII